MANHETQEMETADLSPENLQTEHSSENMDNAAAAPSSTESLQQLSEIRTGLSEIFKKGNENKALLTEMLKDEKVREALKAAARTLANLGIALVDFVPAIGDSISLSADLLKLTSADITPDVSKGLAWGSELLELFTGGIVPSHAIEGIAQFMKDSPRIIEGMERAQTIWSAHQKAVESPPVRDAARVFQTSAAMPAMAG